MWLMLLLLKDWHLRSIRPWSVVVFNRGADVASKENECVCAFFVPLKFGKDVFADKFFGARIAVEYNWKKYNFGLTNCHGHGRVDCRVTLISNGISLFEKPFNVVLGYRQDSCKPRVC